MLNTYLFECVHKYTEYIYSINDFCWYTNKNHYLYVLTIVFTRTYISKYLK